MLPALATLIDAIFASDSPVDLTLHRNLKTIPGFTSGARDRLGGLALDAARHRTRIEDIARRAGEPMDGMSMAIALVLLLDDPIARDVEEPKPYLDAIEAQRDALHDLPPIEALMLGASLPQWFAAMLVHQYGPNRAIELAQALRQRPPMTARVNTLKATREQAMAAMVALEHPFEACALSPLGMRRQRHARLMHLAPWREGWIELQDEGSQLLGLMVPARPGEVVVDACAGAGGKTLLMAAQMQNRGELIALDTSERRLSALKLRARRAGAHNVRIHEAEPRRLAKLRERAHAVLIDAPCSGTGALRRNPDGLWRLSEEAIAGFAQTQRALLDAHAPMLRVGGVMVYATCSVLEQENQRVVASFLANHPNFEAVPVSALLALDIPHHEPEDTALRLHPDRHETDGFFAAAVRRVS